MTDIELETETLHERQCRQWEHFHAMLNGHNRLEFPGELWAINRIQESHNL